MTPTVRRWLSAWLASVALVAAVTAFIKILHPHGPSRGLAVIYILVVLSVAVRWGPGFAFVASLFSVTAFNYYFLSPRNAFLPSDVAGVEACAAFLATAIMASLIANRLRRQVRQADRLTEEQEALRRIASLVARGVPPTEVFLNIATEVGVLLQVELALFARRDPDGLITVLAHWGMNDTDVPVGSRWPLAEPLAVTSPKLIGWNASVIEGKAAFGQFDEAASNSGIQSSIVSPIVVEGHPWGFLFVATRSTVLPAPSTQRMADFSELVATAIRNMESQAELKASRLRIVAAADETRRRIERDLHDGAQQRLVSLSLSVRGVEAAVPAGWDEMRAELSHIADGLVLLLDELREMSRGLHPAILAEGGLRPALKALTRRSPIAVELDVGVARRLPQQAEVTAYYVISELLANAAKYAQASTVQVGVYAPDETLLLSVADDGIGGADPACGSGLVGLRDRVEAIGGTISVRSPLRLGTRVDVEIPIARVTGDR
jgi:signal transduction histidine kinase